VAFDLFDTLVDFDPERFPLVEIDGRAERTTSRVAWEALYGAGYLVPNYPAFHVIWLEVSRVVWEERDRDPEHREVSSLDRFLRLMDRLVAIPSAGRRAAAEVAMEAHMSAIENSTTFDRSHLALLDRIRGAGLALGLVSNFDHAPAARRILDRSGISALVDAVLISEEEGYRKPASRLFLRAAERLGAAPGEVLFVGDTFESDVLGPQSVGMPCAWLNRRGEPLPGGASPPDFEIRRLEETLGILGLALPGGRPAS